MIVLKNKILLYIILIEKKYLKKLNNYKIKFEAGVPGGSACHEHPAIL